MLKEPEVEAVVEPRTRPVQFVAENSFTLAEAVVLPETVGVVSFDGEAGLTTKLSAAIG